MNMHMRELGGITLGIQVQSTQACRNLKKHAFYGEETTAGWYHSMKRLCISAKYIAAVMGTVAWLVSEKRCMETLRWGNSAEDYIIYDVEE